MQIRYCNNCGSEMEPVTHEELSGETVTVAHYCEDCGAAKPSEEVRYQEGLVDG